MKTARLLSIVVASLATAGALGVALSACAAAPPPVKSDEGVPLLASTASAPAAKATPTEATPAASASAAPEKPEKKKPVAGGAPMAVHEDDNLVVATYGSRGGKIRIGANAEMTIPADAIDTATNFILGLNTGKDMLKITPYKGQIGDVYKIGVGRADPWTPAAIASATSPFVLKIALPKGTSTANLVVAVSSGGKLAKYAVVAPKSIEEGDRKAAVFELSKVFPEAIVHLTSAPPTAAE